MPLAYAAGAPKTLLAILLAVLLVVSVTVELARASLSQVRELFTRWTGPLLRAHEFDRWSGATWLIAALLGALLLFSKPIAITAMWAVTAGDAAAAIIGRPFGRLRMRGGKSLEGSLACALVTGLGAHFFAGFALDLCVLSGVAAAVGELPTRPFDDNIRTCGLVGCCLLLWQVAFS